MSALSGDVIVAGQHEGGDIQLRIFGDEFYARYETLDGYSVVYDTTMGQYCYAAMAGGRFISSGIPTHHRAPSGVRKHLHEDPAIRSQKFEHKYATIRPREVSGDDSATRTLGPDNGLLSGRKLHQGDIKGLTILVNFKDIKSTISKEDVDAMMNHDDFTLNGNFGSVKTYYQTMSVGKLNYSNKVVGPVELPQNRGYYINKSLVKDVLDLAVNEFNVDMSEFDSQQEGFVDAINILYAGRSQFSGWLWPHNSIKALEYDGIRTHYYMLSGMGSNRVDLNIGTICHENGHMLCRFPDVYDYGSRDNDQEKSFGLGYYCLMSSGNYLNGGRTPAPLSGYLRDLAGWAEQLESLNNPGEFTLKHGDYGRLLKYHTSLPNEYFLIENRLKHGLDRHLPSNGLAIFHCDILGSNEWQQGASGKHYQLALLQADGHLDLEKNRNRGDKGDMFKAKAGLVIDDTTMPNTLQWDGSDSGLKISDISINQDEITFSVGTLASSRNVRVESNPDIAIPDNDPAGIIDSLTVEAIGVVDTLELELYIMHAWTSDLLITLGAPDGTEVKVYEDIDATSQDLVEAFSTDDVLAELVGKAVRGEWTLKVVDRLQGDMGKLVSWVLNIEKGEAGAIAVGESTPAVQIPENDVKGVTDSISLTPGNDALVKQVVVDVDISHSYADDLLISLQSPQGTQITLLNSGEIGFQTKLKRQFNVESTPALQQLMDESVEGEWTLLVADIVNGDHGQLNQWSIKVVHDTVFG